MTQGRNDRRKSDANSTKWNRLEPPGAWFYSKKLKENAFIQGLVANELIGNFFNLGPLLRLQLKVSKKFKKKERGGRAHSPSRGTFP